MSGLTHDLSGQLSHDIVSSQSVVNFRWVLCDLAAPKSVMTWQFVSDRRQQVYHSPEPTLLLSTACCIL